MDQRTEMSVILEGYLQFNQDCIRTYDINYNSKPPIKEWMTIPIQLNKVRQLIKEQQIQEREKVIIRGKIKGNTRIEVAHICRSFIDPTPEEFFMKNIEIS